MDEPMEEMQPDSTQETPAPTETRKSCTPLLRPGSMGQRQRRTYSYDTLTKAYTEVIDNGMSVYKAARIFSIPEQTLRDRIICKVDICKTKPGVSPLFDQFEEARLSDHITLMSSIGYGYTRAEVLSLATDFAVSLEKKTRDEKELSMRWFYGFLSRWPDLQVRKPKSLSELRAYATSEDKVKNYFFELEKILTKYDLKSRPESIYNVDEKGITLSQSPPFVVGSSKVAPIEICPEKSSNVTLIGCGNALGNQLPPFFIFKGSRMRDELLDGSSPGTDGTVSETGWSNSVIFESYLKDHFLRYARGNQGGKILLLYDGHRSHISPHLIEWAVSQDIILFVLPPHTSHVLQPMDVGCFGPFSKIFLNERHKFQRQNGGSVTRYNICSLACKSYSLALSANNLRSSFRKCGIYPYDPSAIDFSYLQPSKYAKSVVDMVDESTSSPDPRLPGQTSSREEPVATELSKSVENFFTPKLPTLNRKKTSNRRSIHRVVGGKAITERDVCAEVVDYIAVSKKSKKSTFKSSQKSSNTKPKQASSKATQRSPTLSKSVTDISRMQSPVPGPSRTNKLQISDDEFSSDSDIVDDEKCCQCHLFQPVPLQNCVSLVFTKWGQCMYEGCEHWVHLQYCCNVTVLRRHDVFYCPCHGLPCKPEE